MASGAETGGHVWQDLEAPVSDEPAVESSQAFAGAIAIVAVVTGLVGGGLALVASLSRAQRPSFLLAVGICVLSAAPVILVAAVFHAVARRRARALDTDGLLAHVAARPPAEVAAAYGRVGPDGAVAATLLDLLNRGVLDHEAHHPTLTIRRGSATCDGWEATAVEAVLDGADSIVVGPEANAEADHRMTRLHRAIEAGVGPLATASGAPPGRRIVHPLLVVVAVAGAAAGAWALVTLGTPIAAALPAAAAGPLLASLASGSELAAWDHRAAATGGTPRHTGGTAAGDGADPDATDRGVPAGDAAASGLGPPTDGHVDERLLAGAALAAQILSAGGATTGSTTASAALATTVAELRHVRGAPDVVVLAPLATALGLGASWHRRVERVAPGWPAALLRPRWVHPSGASSPDQPGPVPLDPIALSTATNAAATPALGAVPSGAGIDPAGADHAEPVIGAPPAPPGPAGSDTAAPGPEDAGDADAAEPPDDDPPDAVT